MRVSPYKVNPAGAFAPLWMLGNATRCLDQYQNRLFASFSESLSPFLCRKQTISELLTYIFEYKRLSVCICAFHPNKTLHVKNINLRFVYQERTRLSVEMRLGRSGGGYVTI